eukprot:CAMPEP_0181379934 /NCGR_PEP_ID=MMETSP1106-20121128/19265_1 /TAXON_ID=81844 /ORGANISM="Mantoniella antarctica, Strain SL-175" /LENGTH=42 /DNA_ID= /DNA_START= /DNA_END= /DNA_ORIENTATION=
MAGSTTPRHSPNPRRMPFDVTASPRRITSSPSSKNIRVAGVV